jgi:hypothetical protein
MEAAHKCSCLLGSQHLRFQHLEERIDFRDLPAL